MLSTREEDIPMTQSDRYIQSPPFTYTEFFNAYMNIFGSRHLWHHTTNDVRKGVTNDIRKCVMPDKHDTFKHHEITTHITFSQVHCNKFLSLKCSVNAARLNQSKNKNKYKTIKSQHGCNPSPLHDLYEGTNVIQTDGY